jgi:hypothetical protein
MERVAFGNAPKSQNKKKRLDRDTDILNDKFGMSTSPIVRKITKSTDLEIDRGKPAG